jgi:hypothetical protein
MKPYRSIPQAILVEAVIALEADPRAGSLYRQTDDTERFFAAMREQ